jgi:Fic family protein
MMENLKTKLNNYIDVDDYLKSKKVTTAEARILAQVICRKRATLKKIKTSTGKSMSTIHNQLNNLVLKGVLEVVKEKGSPQYYQLMS